MRCLRRYDQAACGTLWGRTGPADAGGCGILYQPCGYADYRWNIACGISGSRSDRLLPGKQTGVNQQIDDQGDTHTKVELDTVDHANDVPVENNTDYDKTPDQHHDPATTVEDEELNLTMFQALDKFLVLDIR